ncbi:MAG: hypothetical protein PVI79_14370 [Gammaproteobacteria bacterium]|jgi:hypothetical protein
MSGTKKRDLADSEDDSDSTVTQLNTDITENLKSMPEDSLGPRERRRLREVLEREHAESAKRWSLFSFLFGSR